MSCWRFTNHCSICLLFLREKNTMRILCIQKNLFIFELIGTGGYTYNFQNQIPSRNHILFDYKLCDKKKFPLETSQKKKWMVLNLCCKAFHWKNTSITRSKVLTWMNLFLKVEDWKLLQFMFHWCTVVLRIVRFLRWWYLRKKSRRLIL